MQTNVLKVGSAGLDDWLAVGSGVEVEVTEAGLAVPRRAVPSPVFLKMML